MQLAVVHYQRKGFRPQRLITSLLDPEQYPAGELIALYHERWEIELGYDEMKTNMLESIPLRSKSVDRVRQELWGLLIAYNLIRFEMERAADEAGVPPTHISFVAVFRMICDEWLWCAIASPGAIPRHLRNLRKNISLFVLPPRRPERSYPRAVKVKMSNYPKNAVPPNARAPQGLEMIQHFAYLTGIGASGGISPHPLGCDCGLRLLHHRGHQPASRAPDPSCAASASTGSCASTTGRQPELVAGGSGSAHPLLPPAGALSTSIEFSNITGSRVLPVAHECHGRG